VVSEHATTADAFAEIERLAAQSDYVELLVVDADGQPVRRPAH
jgi:hypothetical protein